MSSRSQYLQQIPSPSSLSAGRPPALRLRPIAALLAGLTLVNGLPALAADDAAVAALQAEVARLKQELEKSKQELAAQKAGAAATAGAPPAAAPAAASATQAAPTTPVPAGAAETETQDLEAVVVRSRNRIEKLQDVPISVSVVTGQELAELDTTSITALVQRAGNVQWNFGNQRTSSLSIRGIGKQGQTEAQDPAVGLIVDGVSYAYNALSSAFDFTDINTLEVARGPQSTLLGKNASVGAISVTTNRPSFTPEGNFRLIFGQRQTVQEQAAYGGPIIDDLLAWRGNFSASKGQGYITNQYAPDLTYSNVDRVTGRVQFLLTPSDTFTARFEADLTPNGGEYTNNGTVYTRYPLDYSNGTPVNLTTTTPYRLNRSWFTQNSAFTVNGNYLYNGPASGISGYTVDINAGQPLITGSRGATVDLNWKLAGGYALQSITAYKGYHFDAINDEGTPFDINNNSGGFLNNYKQLSEELRLTSPIGGLVDYQAGLYFLDVQNTNEYRKQFGNDAGAFYASDAQYKDLYATGAGRYLLQQSLSGLALDFNSPAGYQDIRNYSDAIYGQANWHFSDQITLATGLRLTAEDRENLAYSAITSNGEGGALNPVAVNGVPLGGFGSNPTNGQLLGSDTAAQVALANSVAQQYFGVATYNALTAAQQTQVADAKKLRQTQIGVLFPPTNAQSFHKILPSGVISPSYKINEDQTAYLSIQHGEKSGVAQLTNGISNTLRPERTTAVELGLKSILLDHTLIFDIDTYLMNVVDYQQTTSILDAYTTTLNNGSVKPPYYYTSATSNVPEVQSKGVEIDSKYIGIKYTTLRFAGAFTDAKYLDYSNAPQAVENGYAGSLPYTSLSGHQLPGAAKWTYNVGADVRIPVDLWGAERIFHGSANIAYSSPFNSDPALSSYAWIGSSYRTDLAIGLGNATRNRFDLSLLVKNAFNDHTPLSRTWSSFTPSEPRWIGVVFSGKL